MGSEGLILVKALIALMPGACLALGALDNILHPAINRDDVARVLALEALNEYPEIKARLNHRAITDQRVVWRLFAGLVAAETVASLLLLAGSVGLALSLLGLVPVELALAVAIAGATAFTGVWASMLVGGQWFYYWYGGFGQGTHFLATLWGLGTLLVLLN